MAQRRMFSLKIVSSDAFLDLPTSSRELYFQLGMYADDDGFVNPKKIMRMIGASEDDTKLLLAKRFILPFENGVVVIKHWLVNNLIRKDFYQETIYLEEKNRLTIKDNKAYTECQQIVNNLETQDRLGKDRLGKDSIEIGNGDKSPTPTQIAKDFFNNPEKQDEIIKDLIARGIPEVLATKEINKFCAYWTEPNKSGRKERWEMERTFEINRRLSTWFSRIKDFSRSQNSKQREILSTT